MLVRFFSTCIAVLSLAVVGIAAADPIPTPGVAHPLEAGDLSAWLDGLAPYALKNGDIAGMVIAVVKDGKVLFEKGYGLADVAARKPMDPETVMVRIGSTSKLFTWTAVMQLVEQGKLDLDRDVNDYLDFKVPEPYGKPITMRDLMNHRAGFEEGLKDVLSIDPNDAQSTEQYLKTHPRPLLYPPGLVPAYSNYGVALAGYIVQRVSGEPFEQYINGHIFTPLDMAHSSFAQPLEEKFRDLVSKGYRTASSPPLPYELVLTRPAGSVTATAADMTHFMIAQLQGGRYGDTAILKPETTRLMQSPSETGLEGFATMAHGFFHETHNGKTVIGHGGDTILFHTEMNLLPDDGVGIFYCFNSRGRADAVYGARKALFDGFMDRYFPAAAPADGPPPVTAQQDAAEIAGLYQGSRRVEHGFMSFFYLLQQASVVANPDGTITEGESHYREIGPKLWRKTDSADEIALADVGGVKTIISSDDPTSVLQAVPFLRSTSLNLPVLLGSFTILVWTVVLWPLSALLRDGVAATPSPAIRNARLIARLAALVDVAYLVAWFALLKPLLSSQVEIYNDKLDPTVSTLQYAGLLVVAAAAFGLWSLWRIFASGASWRSRIWSLLIAAALIEVVWIGLLGNLIGFNLNY